MVEIRSVLAKDAEEIVNLAAQLGYETDVKNLTDRISKLESEINNCIFIAVIDKLVVGWIQGIYAIRLETSPFVEITGLVVDVQHRKMNIGRKLIAEVLKWAGQLHVDRVVVRSNTIRDESHKFYEKSSFKLKKEQKVFENKI